jgi:hypothetical protein
VYCYAAEEQVRSCVADVQAAANLDIEVVSAKENATAVSDDDDAAAAAAAVEVAGKRDTTDYKDLGAVDTKNVETMAALDAVDTADAHFATWEEAAGQPATKPKHFCQSLGPSHATKKWNRNVPASYTCEDAVAQNTCRSLD